MRQDISQLVWHFAKVTLAEGLHLRPIAAFVEIVDGSGYTVLVQRDGGEPVPGNSVVSILGLALGRDEALRIGVPQQASQEFVDSLIALL